MWYYRGHCDFSSMISLVFFQTIKENSLVQE